MLSRLVPHAPPTQLFAPDSPRVVLGVVRTGHAAPVGEEVRHPAGVAARLAGREKPLRDQESHRHHPADGAAHARVAGAETCKEKLGYQLSHHVRLNCLTLSFPNFHSQDRNFFFKHNYFALRTKRQ